MTSSMSDDLKVDWGAIIEVNGVRPAGISGEVLILWSNNAKPWKSVRFGDVRQWGDCDNWVRIRLPAAHHFYGRALERDSREG